MWRVVLVGKDCPLSVFDDMALIEAELFTVLQTHVPDLSYIAPGAPIARRNLEESNESEADHQSRGLQTSTCPKRWQCKKDAWEGKSKRNGDVSRSQAEGSLSHAAVYFFHQIGATFWDVRDVQVVAVVLFKASVQMPRPTQVQVSARSAPVLTLRNVNSRHGLTQLMAPGRGRRRH